MPPHFTTRRPSPTKFSDLSPSLARGHHLKNCRGLDSPRCSFNREKSMYLSMIIAWFVVALFFKMPKKSWQRQMAPPCACHSQRLPSMMSSKLAREWQAPAETTTVRPLKELKISPIIDYVVKPNPVFAQQWFNVMFVTTTTFFAIANFFSPTQYLFVGYYIARNANEKMPSILHIRRRKWMNQQSVR